ncbi:HTTM domain-containing protein [Rhodohalobacter barkolensis]|uniref:HTTM domain-containing protein n=1 Tax=Rhodohalobacter barkolensis TaxID=2053187 RepID=A0A2N0VJV3_9BACT|nr:HTTM domain-containing protein [Rhodohalobacter barkolensis]PKD44470.1 HTTM domain-containing protein [Rhodohalobacter barkolensis]
MNRFSIQSYFNKTTDAAPLAVFRIFFGLLMLISIIRFAANGWIHKLYIEPEFFFSYYGFEWVQPLGEWTYLIFIICGASAIFVSLGYHYRVAIITFFLSFTYIELMDKTTYLNHYYFISILSFLMIFLPAHAYYSIDARRNEALRASRVPSWSIDSIKLLLGIVYFYAGLAKLNSDWLLRAMPLEIWLPSKYSLPLLGDLFQQSWTHYAFSWAGAIYDLTIPFLLLMKRTRLIAFGLVVIFHVLTRVLFPIGMFPYIMIVSALIFFDANLHHRILRIVSNWFSISKSYFDNSRSYSFSKPWLKKGTVTIISIFFLVQLLVPFRYLLYPGELFWTEQGYRFSWRVMLMEKTGYANFRVEDRGNGQSFYVDNNEFLTPFQEKQMSTQPDFILEYAHHLEKHYQSKGIEDPGIYVESYVALNGRGSQPYVRDDVDLTEINQSFKHRTWLYPFNDEIKGL